MVTGISPESLAADEEVVIPDWKKPSLTAKHKDSNGVHTVGLDLLPHTVDKDRLADKTATTKFRQSMKKAPAVAAGPGSA